MKKIAVFTSTRADYGILSPLIKSIQADKDLELNLIVTGTHLSQKFGNTVKEIESDGLPVKTRIESISEGSGEEPAAIYAATLTGMVNSFRASTPDLLVILGDRYEAHAAASAATLFKVPVAHFHGGELTYGAVDEFYRHSITKLSMYHFTATDEYRSRVILMGESPERVFNVGSLAFYNLRSHKLLDRNSLVQTLQIPSDKKLGLVTYHPVTILDEKENLRALDEVTKVLSSDPGTYYLITKCNIDSLGSLFNKRFEELAVKFPDRMKVVDSLGVQKYFSAMSTFDFMMGNTSSGIIESPLFKIPVINIGDRQKGRIRPANVIDVPADSEKIRKAVSEAVSISFREKLKTMINPYEKQNGLDVVMDFLRTKSFVFEKEFFEVRHGS